MTSNPSIRKAVYEKDLDTLYDLINSENGKDIFKNVKRLGNDKNSSQVKFYIDHMWVWEHDGKVIGYVAIIERDSNIKSVQVLTVHHDHQGQGIGSKLMDFVESCGGVIHVYVYEAHERVKNFYTRRGYLTGKTVFVSTNLQVPADSLYDPNTKAMLFSKDMSMS